MASSDSTGMASQWDWGTGADEDNEDGGEEGGEGGDDETGHVQVGKYFFESLTVKASTRKGLCDFLDRFHTCNAREI